jgi:hypothetical protein
VQQLKALSGQLGTDGGEAGEIARGTIEARYQAHLDGVDGYPENDGDSLRRRLDDLRCCNSHDSNNRHMLANEIGGERRQPVTIALAGLNGHVAAHDVTGLRQTLVEPR